MKRKEGLINEITKIRRDPHPKVEKILTNSLYLISEKNYTKFVTDKREILLRKLSHLIKYF